MFEGADLIHRYTRADAIRDGVLIDVSAVAREAGIRYPVALTRAAWERCVAVPPGVRCQDEAGRLWNVLFLLRCAVGRSAGATGDPLRRSRPQQQPGGDVAAGAPQGGLRPRRQRRACHHGHDDRRGLTQPQDRDKAGRARDPARRLVGPGPPAAPFARGSGAAG
jgi:hypothetical protein